MTNFYAPWIGTAVFGLAIFIVGLILKRRGQ